MEPDFEVPVSWGSLGAVLGPLGVLLEPLRGPPGELLGCSWNVARFCGLSWGPLGANFENLYGEEGLLGHSWGALGSQNDQKALQTLRLYWNLGFRGAANTQAKRRAMRYPTRGNPEKRKITKKPTRLISTSHSVSFAGTKSRVRTLGAPELCLSMSQRSWGLNGT